MGRSGAGRRVAWGKRNLLLLKNGCATARCAVAPPPATHPPTCTLAMSSTLLFMPQQVRRGSVGARTGTAHACRKRLSLFLHEVNSSRPGPALLPSTFQGRVRGQRRRPRPRSRRARSRAAGSHLPGAVHHCGAWRGACEVVGRGLWRLSAESRRAVGGWHPCGCCGRGRELASPTVLEAWWPARRQRAAPAPHPWLALVACARVVGEPWVLGASQGAAGGCLHAICGHFSAPLCDHLVTPALGSHGPCVLCVRPPCATCPWALSWCDAPVCRHSHERRRGA